MSIRNTSYYGFRKVEKYSPDSTEQNYFYSASFLDEHQNVYFGGYTNITASDDSFQKNALVLKRYVRENDSISRLRVTDQLLTSSTNTNVAYSSKNTVKKIKVSPYSGKVYVCAAVEMGTYDNLAWVVLTSSDQGSTFAVRQYSIEDEPTGDNIVYDVALSASGEEWFCGRIRDSGAKNAVSTFVDGISVVNPGGLEPGGSEFRTIQINEDDDGKIYVSGLTGSDEYSLDDGWMTMKSADHGSSWTNIDVHYTGSYEVNSMVLVGGYIFVGGTSSNNARIRRASTSSDTVWADVLNSALGASRAVVESIAYDSKNAALYAMVRRGDKCVVLKSTNFNTGTASSVVWTEESKFVSMRLGNFDSKGFFGGIGYLTGASDVYIANGLTANSASLAASSLAVSYGYVFSELSGAVNEKFALNNVSEFPHSFGIYQMKNMILGTIDSGKIGKDEDSIVQVKHKGSFVKVLWPRQDIDSFVKGYGDFSQGQKSGKLTTDFSSGDFINVTEYDHATLYCYLKKEASGTLDDVIVRFERRPLRDVPFTSDQSITYQDSGSYTEAVLKDLLFVKNVDYGDLSISEIGYPIDIPLVNTRELRVSCRHKNGQSIDANKNFIIWGRLIKADVNTNET